MNIRQQIREDLDKRGENLTCDMFKDFVKIVHGDGSIFLLENVIVEEKRYVQLDVYLVWTEHCGYFYFFKDDLELFRKWSTNS